MVGRANTHRGIGNPSLGDGRSERRKNKGSSIDEASLRHKGDRDGGHAVKGRDERPAGAPDSLPRRPRCRAPISVLTGASAIIEGMTASQAINDTSTKYLTLLL